MEKELFNEYDDRQRVEMLESNADEIVEMDYVERLTEEELAEAKNRLALRSIEESRLKDDKKAYSDSIKAKMDPITKEKELMLTEIKHGSRSLFGKCYKMVDHASQEVGFYNSRGQLVYSRPANAEEKQKTIFSLKREGTNG